MVRDLWCQYQIISFSVFFCFDCFIEAKTFYVQGQQRHTSTCIICKHNFKKKGGEKVRMCLESAWYGNNVKRLQLSIVELSERKTEVVFFNNYGLNIRTYLIHGRDFRDQVSKMLNTTLLVRRLDWSVRSRRKNEGGNVEITWYRNNNMIMSTRSLHTSGWIYAVQGAAAALSAAIDPTPQRLGLLATHLTLREKNLPCPCDGRAPTDRTVPPTYATKTNTHVYRQ